MLTADFDYDLPTERIALEPVPRGRSRLLVVPAADQPRQSLRVDELPRLLEPGDVMVLNNTRVIPARLKATKSDTGAGIEILLVERLATNRWRALVRPAKKLRASTKLILEGGLSAQLAQRHSDGSVDLRFSAALEPVLQEIGQVPLPPYIRRTPTAADKDRYQTVYAKEPGAVAAPTAGLHFSTDLLEQIREVGVEIVEITHHIGPGTFRPVRVSNVSDHRMEDERYRISPEAAASIESAKKSGRRIVAVGTTVVRALESAASASTDSLAQESARTDLFIYPGYRFSVVDVLLTNFHLPRSTLLMLVCAFAGRSTVLDAYEHAVQAGYRFYSYGDAMLLERST